MTPAILTRSFLEALAKDSKFRSDVVAEHSALDSIQDLAEQDFDAVVASAVNSFKEDHLIHAALSALYRIVPKDLWPDIPESLHGKIREQVNIWTQWQYQRIQTA